MKKRILSLVCFIAIAATQLLYADGNKRTLLQDAADINKLKEVLVMDQKWVPYPDYVDRAGWDKLLGENKESTIKVGEKYLGFEWKVVKATDYLEYERTGNREIMQNPLGANNQALSALVMAELAEGKGRFMDDIINGVFHLCEMESWALSAHNHSLSKTKRALPDYREKILELTQGDMSQMLSWTYYFLNKEFDKVDPVISLMLRKELQERELTPYLNLRHFWWMAHNAKPGDMVNNWNPWCNFNALICFFLLENDKNVLAEAVYKSMTSVDAYINAVKEDGGCDEGPSYWGHAAGKMYDYLQMLSLGTGGKVSIFDKPQIRNMGEYIVRSYIGNGWVVNFADASARGGGDAGLIYRYGTAVNSDVMKGYAATMNKEKPVKPSIGSTDLFRTLETMRWMEQLNNEAPKYTTPEYTWYPQTEFCYFSNKSGMFMATKGGYNDESHNHNDTGTFSLYMNNTPILIDAGVGTYTRWTFSDRRYTIWTMQSDYHNLPMINGVSQKHGRQYKATEVKANPKAKTISLNIGTAYPEEAKVEKWIRSYRMGSNNLKIEDTFSLKEAIAPNKVNFLTWGKVDLSQAGVITIEVQGEKAALKYDKNLFDASIETIKLDDPRLSNVWGSEIYRLSLTAKKQQTQGKYSFTISKL